LQRWQYTQQVPREYQALGEGQVVVGVAGFAAMAQALTRVMGLFAAAPSQTGSLGYAYLSPYLPQRGWIPIRGYSLSCSHTRRTSPVSEFKRWRRAPRAS
jgi:hypothetical protein